MFQYGFGVVPVLHDTIIAHNSFSVIGKVLPKFFTTCAKVMPWRQIVLAAVSDGTIIAHNSFSVIGNLLPKFFTTFDRENAIWLPLHLVVIFDNTIITCFVCLVTGTMLPIYFTTFVSLARGLNHGAVLDTIIINTFISHVISIMFPISSRVFPITQATRIASIYIIAFQNGAIYGVVPNFKQIHSSKTGVLQTICSVISEY